ncbi:hypothetical protein [Microtetraspora sp. NBRC 16547]|uniref:hypothetical protein n=1 Tax=Microtetraspora sp. NBRC 16547 TaxID=3030993 RepID=UPI0025534D30|nr:hypothetical protein [Microtetraspora sp. NBRC 16547]
MISTTAEKLQNIPKQRHAKTQQAQETMSDVTGQVRDTFEGAEGRMGEERGPEKPGPGGPGGPESR